MNTREIEDIYELSPLQEGMLFHTLYEPESRLYFEQLVVAFEGVVDMTAFEATWNAVAEANTALRTSFHWEQTAKPVQVVHRQVRVPVEVTDLRDLPVAERDARLQSLLATERQRGF